MVEVESILTSGVIIVGLSSWLGKVWANRILEKDKLKYTLEIEWLKTKYTQELEKYKVQTEKSIFVHKLQYEKEFEIYSEIWESLFDLHVNTQQLRPILDKLPEDVEERKEEKITRAENFSNSYNRFSKLVKKYSPFYPKGIYDSFIELRNKLNKEGLDFQLCDIENLIKTDWRALERRLKEIEVLIENISESIRERIEQMRVL